MSNLAQVVRVVGLITESVRVAGEIPNGTLYAAMMPVLPNLEEFEVYSAAVRMAKRARLIEERASVLHWIGPTIEEATP
jgi:hypothetical protein